MASYHETNSLGTFDFGRLLQQYKSSAPTCASYVQPKDSTESSSTRPDKSIRLTSQQGAKTLSALRRQGCSGTSNSQEMLESSFKGPETSHRKKPRGLSGASGQTWECTSAGNFHPSFSGDFEHPQADENLPVNSLLRRILSDRPDLYYQTPRKGPEVATNLHSFSHSNISPGFRSFRDGAYFHSSVSVPTVEMFRQIRARKLFQIIEECRIQLKHVFDSAPEAQFFLEIGSVLQMALFRWDQERTDWRSDKVPPRIERQFRLLEKFAELFQNTALPSIRSGQLALAWYQLSRQTTPEV